MSDSYHDARCAAVYDIFEGPERSDLAVYAAMVTIFGSDSTRVDEASTLRFRRRAALTHSVGQAGFIVEEIRDAPDRPGRELVFVARTV
ncbi:MAG: hypothetical protein L0J17_07805 [Brevibacterium sp.]|uniref:hypothetical protein n=1 Tax=Brevibacterium sp. TaxID=1701 RepID=UPI00264932B1|nr:hypothetical protein [Brevibacterium sp.]MDN5806428.1 hypothetical protein [Brevibacterium sp.]MDN5834301.1 hypothetical protein [Brevibacterium sp.]MDN5876922.1 hypothetical protein [Brevibacterium sp.]MDN5908601.1 hypothetical protein [Brevibacterium sp.]MDN6157108.1 hypothetical protein [Brevibacterium sp.]